MKSGKLTLERSEVVSWSALVVLAVAFVGHAGAPVIWLLAAAVTVSGLSIEQPRSAVALLSATALLGPIATLNLPGGLIIHLGDIYLGALFLKYVLRDGLSFPVRFGTLAPLVAVLMCGVLASWLFSIDMVAAVPTIVGIAELILVFLLTEYAVRDIEDAKFVIGAWVIAVTLSSMLVIVSYLRGDVLILGATPEARAHAQSLQSSEVLLFRASFFVTSFIFPLAAVVAVSAARLMFDSVSRRTAHLLVAALAVNGSAVLVMANATAAIGALIGISSLLLFLPWMRKARPRFAVGLLGTLLAAVVVIAVVREMFSPAQLALLLGRRSDASSLQARFFVWRNVWEFLLDSPHAMYLGLGPDVSIRLASNPMIKNLFFGGGLQQGAVDNGYLYLALDYGIIVLIAVMVTGLVSLSVSFSAALRGETIGVMLWVIIVVWGVMSLGQQHGVAKPVFMIIQAVALADIVRARLGRGRRAPTPAMGGDPSQALNLS